MATVEIAFLAPIGGVRDSAAPSSVQIITSTAGNIVSTAGDVNGGTCVVTATGGNVYVAFGTAPNATTDTKRRLVLDGQTRAFSGMTPGHKAAVVNA